MPKRPDGVYSDGRGGWYVKVFLGCDPITGRIEQITRRGFSSASEAGKARRELLAKVDRHELRPVVLTVDRGWSGCHGRWRRRCGPMFRIYGMDRACGSHRWMTMSDA
jgi:hypothetical protein